jgi:hypothetical protein
MVIIYRLHRNTVASLLVTRNKIDESAVPRLSPSPYDKSCARKNEKKIGKEKNLSGGYQNCEKLFPLTFWFLSFWEDGVCR